MNTNDSIDQKKIEGIVSTLKDDTDRFARARAALMLGMFANKKGILTQVMLDALINALTENACEVRDRAAVSLGAIGEPAKIALPTLKHQLAKESDKDTKFQLAIAITRIERQKGIGTKIIEEMDKNWLLDDQQIAQYYRILQILNLNQKTENTSNTIQSITHISETIGDSEEKRELLKQISELDRQNKELKEQLDQYLSFESDPWSIHNKQLIRIYQEFDCDDLSEVELMSLEKKATTLANLKTALPEKKKKFFEKWTWEEFIAAILGAIITGVIGFLIAYFVT